MSATPSELLTFSVLPDVRAGSLAAAPASAPDTLPDAVAQPLAAATQEFVARHYDGAITGFNAASVAASLQISSGSSGAALLRAFNFVIPMSLGDCKVAVGDWQGANKNYSIVSRYSSLDPGTEAPQLWAKMAGLYVAWADSLYLGGAPDDARALYEEVVTTAGAVPTSALYTTAPIAPGATLAKQVIAQLEPLTAGAAGVGASVNPTVAMPIVDAYVKLGQIAAGLHFYGFAPLSVPIWKFEYLQQVATQYCQYAVTTEQNVISYWDRADQSQLTAVQLAQQVVDSQTAVAAAREGLGSATAEANAYQAGLTLATVRAHDAQADVSSYGALQSQAVLYSAMAAQVSGGRDGDPEVLNSLVDRLQQGESIRGARSTVAAADQLMSSRLSQQYELASLARTAAEMTRAGAQAQADLTAAQARVTAAAGQVALAQLHASEAQTVLASFSADTFTPEVWRSIGDRLYTLYRRYLAMALRAAQLMQQAYNFENDAQLAVIRDDYSSNEVRGLLAAEMLLADVSSFTDQQLTDRRGKSQPITHTVSLATRHSYQFETQFRRTGIIEFDTTPDDFDLAYPGTYNGRVRHVDVAVQGLVGTAGVSGTLTNAGVSFYRTPTDTWTDADPDHMKRRLQPSETLVLSDYARPAGLDDVGSPGPASGVFDGAGVIGTWRLEIPPEVNDLDYDLLTDVLITFSYEAQFDFQLAATVKRILDTQAGAHVTQIGLPLRWLYPDAFFDLVNTRRATVTIAPSDLPLNQTATSVTQLGLLATTAGGHAPALSLSVTAPTATAASTVTTDANGLATSTTAGSPLATQLGNPVVGDWALATDTDPTGLANLTLLLEYGFTPRTST